MANESPTDVARRIIDENSYATLATADVDGRPWVTPVWFAERGLRQYGWVSRTTRRHSQNVAQRAEIALVVFDSTAPGGSGSAVYVEAAAAQVPDHELPVSLSVIQREVRGIRTVDVGSVEGFG